MVKRTEKTKRRPRDDDYEKELEKEASDDAAREKARGSGLGNKISIRNRRFTLGEEKIGREMVCAIVDFVYLNTLYKGKFDSENIKVPDCFAIAAKQDDLEPHENSTDPQSEACEGCPMNEWGSGKGNSKACGQRRRLAVMHVDDIEDADAVEEAFVATLELPPTSVSNWASYLKSVKAKQDRPVYAVLTKLSFDPDESYPKIVFEFEKNLDSEVVDAIRERREEVREMLLTPYETNSSDDDDDDDDKPRKKRKTRRDEDEDEDEDDSPPKRKRRASKSKDEDEDEDDETDTDDDEEDDDEDEENDKKVRSRKQSSKQTNRSGKRSRSSDEDDEDDEDDEEDDEEDEEDDDAPSRRSAGKRKRRDKDDDDEDTDSDDDDDDDDESTSKSRRKNSRKAEENDNDDDDSDEDEEEDEPKRKKRGSRFGK